MEWFFSFCCLAGYHHVRHENQERIAEGWNRKRIAEEWQKDGKRMSKGIL